MKIKVTDKISIGDSEPVFIVAEVGSNWASLGDCLHSINMAKACGADAVKFQAFNHHALYGSGDGTNDPATPMMNSLPIEWLPKLKIQADAVGIEFMCSAFSPELAEAVNPFVNIHKIASAELTHLRLLEKTKSFGKPVFISTGASGDEDIARALLVLGKAQTALLYCVAAYPAQEVELGNINSMRLEFGTLVGYSDHTTDTRVIPREATLRGACVLEKHFTAIEANTPDSGHSLGPHLFLSMVDSIRQQTQAVRPRSTRDEKDMVLRHNRRLIATKDVVTGDVLIEGKNFGIYRSLKDDTHAFSPWLVNEVHGKFAAKFIRAGDGIGPGDV